MKEYYTVEEPIGIRLLKYFKRYVNFVHNPLITGILLTLIAVYINANQVVFLQKYPQYKELVQVTDYTKDFYSNILNIVFLIRFPFNKVGNTFTEFLLFMVQTSLITIDVKTSQYKLELDLYLILYIFQMVSFTIYILLILTEYYKEAINFKKLLASLNNSALPILLNGSFKCINERFDFTTDPVILLLYVSLIILVKFYCLYQFAYFELVNTLFEEPIVVYERDSKSIYLVVTTLILLVLDSWCICILFQ